MPERIFIGVAWPYANGPLHLGHVAGCYLASDIFARYHRMKGNDVLMVSGSDTHGTPITVRADQESVEPQEVVDRYHAQFLDSWEGWGCPLISLRPQIPATTRKLRKKSSPLSLKAAIYTDQMLLAYCPDCDRFLADRYVEGICPLCGDSRAAAINVKAAGARWTLKTWSNPGVYSREPRPNSGSPSTFFLKLSAFQEPLLEWVRGQTHWRPNVLNFTRRYLEDGLKDRAITRDMSWGIKLPLEGYEDKRIYVWFEAVIGYLSAAIEWAKNSGHEESWQDFWKDPSTKSYYFIGKDNIPFHTIIWPAMLMGYGGLTCLRRPGQRVLEH